MSVFGQHKLAALLHPHLPSFFCYLNKEASNQEVYCSEQCLKEHDLSLLLMIDSHHQQ